MLERLSSKAMLAEFAFLISSRYFRCERDFKVDIRTILAIADMSADTLSANAASRWYVYLKWKARVSNGVEPLGTAFLAV